MASLPPGGPPRSRVRQRPSGAMQRSAGMPVSPVQQYGKSGGGQWSSMTHRGRGNGSRSGGGSTRGMTQRDQYENTLRNLLSMSQDDFEARVVSTQLEATTAKATGVNATKLDTPGTDMLVLSHDEPQEPERSGFVSKSVGSAGTTGFGGALRGKRRPPSPGSLLLGPSGIPPQGYGSVR